MRISDWSSDVCSSDLVTSLRESEQRGLTQKNHFLSHQPERQQDELIGKGNRRREIDFRYATRSEEHTSELQSLMRISYAVFCLKKKKKTKKNTQNEKSNENQQNHNKLHNNNNNNT